MPRCELVYHVLMGSPHPIAELKLIVVLSSALLAASAAPVSAQCVGSAYFQPFTEERVKLYHYTSEGVFDLGVWTQRNCVGLVNLGAVPQTDVKGTFGFESTLGKYKMLSNSVESLAGGKAVSCLMTPTFGPDALTVAEIIATGPMAPGDFTDACCFIFDAEAPQSECESVPGPGDEASGSVEVGFGGPSNFSHEVLLSPQDSPCGLVGIEVFVPLVLIRGLRRRLRKRRAARAARSASLLTLPFSLPVVLPLAALLGLLSGGTVARASDFDVSAGTDVDLTLDAIGFSADPLPISGAQGVDISYSVGGDPLQIRFAGGTLTLQTTSVNAVFGAIADVEATLHLATGRLESGWLPLTPGAPETWTFDPTEVHVILDSGSITASGFVQGKFINVDRPLTGGFALDSTNNALGAGTVELTPQPGATDVVVRVPIDFAEGLSFDTAAAFLGGNGVIEVSATIPDPSLPSVSPPALLLLAVVLLQVGRVSARRLRGRDRSEAPSSTRPRT